MRTRVRQNAAGGWSVDRRVLGLLWFPMGRWIHQDWWAPYDFDTSSEALHFASVTRAHAAIAKAEGR